MKTFLKALQLSVLCCVLSISRSETDAAAPELTPLARKYESGVAASRALLDKSLAAARAPYLAALSAAETKASQSGKPDEVRAILEEKGALAAGRALDQIPSPLLPRSLQSTRSVYFRDIAKAERDHTTRVEGCKGAYLRDLAFVETKARLTNNDPLIQEITDEKAKVVEGSVPAAPPSPSAARGQNLLKNGDFKQKNSDATPADWNHGGTGKGAVVSEGGVSFLRFISADKKETFFLQNVPRPEGVRELACSIRIRCDKIKEGGYGLVIAERDSHKKLIGRHMVCYSKTPARQWRQLRGLIKLKPDTADLVVKVQIDSAGATADFSEVSLEPL